MVTSQVFVSQQGMFLGHDSHMYESLASRAMCANASIRIWPIL